MNLLRRFIRNEDGVTAIEYGLIATGIAVATLAIVNTVGADLTNAFTKVANGLNTAG